MWHWLSALIAWHRANVLGNVVASLEMAAVALLVGRPLLRRIADRIRHHITDQMQSHVSDLHARFDDMMAQLTGTKEETRGGSKEP